MKVWEDKTKRIQWAKIGVILKYQGLTFLYVLLYNGNIINLFPVEKLDNQINVSQH